MFLLWLTKWVLQNWRHKQQYKQPSLSHLYMNFILTGTHWKRVCVKKSFNNIISIQWIIVNKTTRLHVCFCWIIHDLPSRYSYPSCFNRLLITLHTTEVKYILMAKVIFKLHAIKCKQCQCWCCNLLQLERIVSHQTSSHQVWVFRLILNSWTSQYGHLSYMDASQIQTVSYVPTKLSYISSKIKLCNTVPL